MSERMLIEARIDDECQHGAGMSKQRMIARPSIATTTTTNVQRAGVGNFNVNPRFHPTSIGWNRGSTQKFPTPERVCRYKAVCRIRFILCITPIIQNMKITWEIQWRVQRVFHIILITCGTAVKQNVKLMLQIPGGTLPSDSKMSHIDNHFTLMTFSHSILLLQ